MYTTVIGKKFLQAYNLREGTNLTAKEFFVDIYFETFFNHNKYMQWITNSPFVQMKQGQKVDNLTKEERKEKLNTLLEKIETKEYDASIAIGFPSLDLSSTTSAQITETKIDFNEEDVFYSWIGSGLGIGINGGMVLQFENDSILLNIYDGWKYYRSFLNDKVYEKLKGNQINTWNGQWLSHLFSDDYLPQKPLINFTEKAFISNTSGGIDIQTEHWVRVILAISKQINEESTITVVYSLGQTNTTLGFIPIKLKSIAKPIQIYKELFGENNYLKDARKIESLYGTAFGFAAACKRGQIGIQALEPKGLRQYMTNTNCVKVKLPDYKKAKEDDIINYNTYITWVIAMLDNEKLWELSGEAAEHLITFVNTDDKNVSTKRSNLVNAVLDTKSKKQFLESLIPFIEQVKEPKPFVELGEEVNKMVASNFPYFHTLIRFRFAEKNKQ